MLTELFKYIYKRQHLLLLLLSAVDLSRKIMWQGDRTNENRCPMIPHMMQCSHLCSGGDMNILKLIIINSSGYTVPVKRETLAEYFLTYFQYIADRIGL